MNDTHTGYDGVNVEEGGTTPGSSLGSASDTGAGAHSRAQTDSPLPSRISQEACYDQGIQDAWFPPNTSISTEHGGDRVVVTVPPNTDKIRVGEETEKFTYVKVNSIKNDGEEGGGNVRRMGSEVEARSRRQPGTYHDRDTCPGCIAREQALFDARHATNANTIGTSRSPAQNPHLNDNAETSDVNQCSALSSSSDSHLPPYVPSPQTIPPCDGVRDVILTGTTDPRHAAAWGNWAWRGRVRTWDGMVGLVRSAEVDVCFSFLPTR